MKTASTSGGLGDIVYSIPIMKRLGITHVYVKVSYYYRPEISLYNGIKPLLEQCGFIVLPTSGAYPPHEYEPGLKVDYDMDLSRKQPRRGRNHIIISYLNCFRLSRLNWNTPFLDPRGENNIERPYSLIHLTNRWRENSNVNWTNVLNSIKGKVFFIGFPPEWEDFKLKYGDLPYLQTNNILDMAILIRDCETLYCNQSVGLTLAQAIGKKYFCEFKPGRTNCRMYTKNEGVL